MGWPFHVQRPHQWVIVLTWTAPCIFILRTNKQLVRSFQRKKKE